MTEAPKHIGYRLAEPRDAAAIHQLWTGGTSWGSPAGAITEWYEANPHDWSMAVVAVDENDQVVGQFIFMAAQVAVEGRVYRALRPIAPIVAHSLRFIRYEPPALPPMMGMYRYAAERAGPMGVSVFYMLPDQLWARTRLLQGGGFFDHAIFPLWSLPLPRQNGRDEDNGCQVELLTEWGESVNGLWQKTERMHPCLVVRNANTLRWRSARPGHAAFAVRSGGELIGIAVSEIHTKQWLICDLLVADGGEALVATLAAMCRFAEAHSTEERPYEKVSILVTPFLEGALRQLGFERVAYDFPLLAHPVSPEVTREEVAPQRWYVSAND